MTRLRAIFEHGLSIDETSLKTAFSLIKIDKADLHYISTWHRCFPKAAVDKQIMSQLEKASVGMKKSELLKEEELTFSEQCFIEAKGQIMNQMILQKRSSIAIDYCKRALLKQNKNALL